MEKFTIPVNEKLYAVTTSLLKGNGNMIFNIFDDDKLIVNIQPELTKNNRVKWSHLANGGEHAIDEKELQLIGKAIENYYMNKEQNAG